MAFRQLEGHSSNLIFLNYLSHHVRTYRGRQRSRVRTYRNIDIVKRLFLACLSAGGAAPGTPFRCLHFKNVMLLACADTLACMQP